ncbi:MAG: hypothetical protein WCK34_05350, partial [Bacteroidota bacterium]
MKKLLFILLPVLLGLHSMVPAQFRSGIFLHHSTGGCIWGPNGSSTGIPQEMEAYNALHGLAGSQAVGMNEEWWAPEHDESVNRQSLVRAAIL